jgi:phage baseplate assembly protein gpV
MFTSKRLVAFALTCSLGICLASLFTFARGKGWPYVPPGDYELTGQVIKHSPDPVKAGDRVTFTYEVSNTGSSPVPAKSYDVEFYLDGKLVSFDRATSGISVEGRTIYSMSEGYWHVEGISSGVHTFRLVLDPRNRLAERNESNNVVEGKFEVAE